MGQGQISASLWPSQHQRCYVTGDKHLKAFWTVQNARGGCYRTHISFICFITANQETYLRSQVVALTQTCSWNSQQFQTIWWQKGSGEYRLALKSRISHHCTGLQWCAMIQTTDTELLHLFETWQSNLRGKTQVNPRFDAKWPNFLNTLFDQIWIVILYMQFLCPGDRQKSSYGFLPIHLDKGLALLSENISWGIAKMAAEWQDLPKQTSLELMLTMLAAMRETSFFTCKDRNSSNVWKHLVRCITYRRRNYTIII